MKIIETLKAMPSNTCIYDKRILALFKRLGFIYDYSQWGYLESQKVYYMSDWGEEGMKREYDWREGGRLIKDNELGSFESPYPTSEAFYNSQHGSSYFEYKGMKFSINNYHSGCFQPYLHKDK